MILPSKLYPNIVGHLARAKGSHPNSSTQNRITSLILSFDININSGFFLNVSRTTSSDQPQLLKASTFASHRNFETPLLACKAITNPIFEGSNPISLTSSTVLFRSLDKRIEGLVRNK
uniref:Uncharacterized protein n=1 Tax=Cajanus cajan TaxID=3821 RepID=A0A151T627_CAJCA|nr:hypothetical protein KK1_017010 [Cajanus cajan]